MVRCYCAWCACCASAYTYNSFFHIRHMKVRLTKKMSNHQHLRTDWVEGETGDLPTIGECFVMFAKPLDPAADIRGIKTTPVISLEYLGNNTIMFKTANSIYALERLDESPSSDQTSILDLPVSFNDLVERFRHAMEDQVNSLD